MTAYFPRLELKTTEGWQDYGLIDSGNGLKLERFGNLRLIRPEAEAIWKPLLPESEWSKADAVFHPAPEENGGHWKVRTNVPDRWSIEFQKLSCYLQLSRSRHIGIFPEQSWQWIWIQDALTKINKPARILNLFGYTGMATLAAAITGARVTHVDASKKALTWARENQALSKMSEKSIRWLLDDAYKFVLREKRRGSFYDGIILDPPKFGRGPKGEVWEFYKLLPDLLAACTAILSKEPLFFMLTAYAVKASSLTLYTAIHDLMSDRHGKTIAGELVLKEESGGRFLSTAVFGMWHNNQLKD